MNIVSKKEETHTVSFSQNDIADLVRNTAIKNSGFDPEHFEAENLVVKVIKGKKIKGVLGGIPALTVTITNPKDLSPEPDKPSDHDR